VSYFLQGEVTYHQEAGPTSWCAPARGSPREGDHALADNRGRVPAVVGSRAMIPTHALSRDLCRCRRDYSGLDV